MSDALGVDVRRIRAGHRSRRIPQIRSREAHLAEAGEISTAGTGGLVMGSCPGAPRDEPHRIRAIMQANADANLRCHGDRPVNFCGGAMVSNDQRGTAPGRRGCAGPGEGCAPLAVALIVDRASAAARRGGATRSPQAEFPFPFGR